jgi:hypothetical protein
MANKPNPLDELFREKLIDHQVVPSPESWKKIEANLPTKSVSLYTYWWALAASIALVVVGSYVLTSMPNNPAKENQLANKTVSQINQETLHATDRTELQQPELPAQITQNTITPSEKKIDKTSDKKPSQKLGKTESQIINQIAQVEILPTEETFESIKSDLQTQESFAVSQQIAHSEPADVNLEEEPLYRVNIYSNGIKKEKNPKNLFTELHKTVNQVENILEKVDDGLSIQNLKTNLSQTLSAKKEKQSEKP